MGLEIEATKTVAGGSQVPVPIERGLLVPLPAGP